MQALPPHLDIFLSHNWSTPRLWKFLTLALNFNVVSAFAAMIVCQLSLTIFSFNNGHVIRELFLCMVFIFLFWLFLAHDIRSLLGLKSRMLFVDKACIHQTDANLKQQGISSLGAFLLKSRSMLIIYNDQYLKRLWTVYEVATVLTANPDAKIEVRPIFLTKVAVANIGILLCAFLPTSILLGPGHPASIACQATPWLIGGWLTMRYWAKKRNEMHAVVEQFDLRNAKCFSEDDRSYVNANVSYFMLAYGLVSEQATYEETLDAFNEHVKCHVPRVLKASLPRCGVPYKFAISLFAYDFCTNFFYIAEHLEANGSTFQLVLHCVHTIVTPFFMLPNTLGVMSLCATRSLRCGVCGQIGWCVFTFIIVAGIFVAHFRAKSLAMNETTLGVIFFVAVEVANIVAVSFEYRRGSVATIGSSPNASADAASCAAGVASLDDPDVKKIDEYHEQQIDEYHEEDNFNIAI